MGDEQKILELIESFYPDRAFDHLLILADLYEETGRNIERCEGLRWLAEHKRTPHDMGRAPAGTFRFLFREPVCSKYDLPMSLFGRTNHWMRFATATETWLDAADAFAAVKRGDFINRRPNPLGEFDNSLYEHAMKASIAIEMDLTGLEFWNTSFAYAMLKFRNIYLEHRQSIIDKVEHATSLALEKHHDLLQ